MTDFESSAPQRHHGVIVNNVPAHPLTPAQTDALEARFARRLSARLDDGVRHLPHDITERLRVARSHAVEQARRGQAAQLAGSASMTATRSGGSAASLVLGGGPGDDGPTWGQRLAALLPLVALVAGLWAIGQLTYREQVQAAAEVDTALLTDELPPAAYADPGFEEFLLGSNESTGQPAALSGEAPGNPDLGGSGGAQHVPAIGATTSSV